MLQFALIYFALLITLIVGAVVPFTLNSFNLDNVWTDNPYPVGNDATWLLVGITGTILCNVIGILGLLSMKDTIWYVFFKVLLIAICGNTIGIMTVLYVLSDWSVEAGSNAYVFTCYNSFLFKYISVFWWLDVATLLFIGGVMLFTR
jgi:hypothetical protein